MSLQEFSNKIDAYGRLMRIDKQIGTLLLLWPTLWALLVAGRGRPDGFVVMIFVLGTVLMRSAGCVMNDIADVKYDGKVERTKNRPLATNEVSKKEAYFLALALSLLSFALVCMLNLMTIKLSIFALFLAVTYPLTKRFLAIPQAYLGITFGMGIPMAFAAITGDVPLVAWLMLCANIFWAIAYDTEYAMVDREDDLKIGIQSSAITFGRFDVIAVMICYGLTLLLLATVGQLLDFGMIYYSGLIFAVLIAGYHYHLIKTRNKALCFKAFLQNNWFGFAIFFGLATEYLLF